MLVWTLGAFCRVLHLFVVHSETIYSLPFRIFPLSLCFYWARFVHVMVNSYEAEIGMHKSRVVSLPFPSQNIPINVRYALTYITQWIVYNGGEYYAKAEINIPESGQIFMHSGIGMQNGRT